MSKQRPSSHLAGLRTVATFEALKGALAIVVGLGLFSLRHRDATEMAEHLLHHLHLGASRHFSQALLHTAERITYGKLIAVAFGAFAYAAIRFIEAYGLWHARDWAEWFALLSGALYLPWEIYELARRATPFRWSILLINIGIVLYMAYVRFSMRQEPAPELVALKE